MSNFHSLEVVGRDSETQLQVGENFTWTVKGYQVGETSSGWKFNLDGRGLPISWETLQQTNGVNKNKTGLLAVNVLIMWTRRLYFVCMREGGGGGWCVLVLSSGFSTGCQVSVLSAPLSYLVRSQTTQHRIVSVSLSTENGRTGNKVTTR